MSHEIRLSEVHKKTGAELVFNGIVGRNLRTKQKVTSQIRPHNSIVDEFGTSLPLNFGKANWIGSVSDKRNIAWETLRGKRDIFSQYRVFPSNSSVSMQFRVSTSVSITRQEHGKNVFYIL